MIVRKIRKEECKRVRQFGTLAFEYPMTDSELSAEEMFQRIAEHPANRQELNWHSRWAAFEDDDKTMMSNFAAIPYRVVFDGHEVGMMGIGSVATLPQYRRRGGVRACFEKALPDMYDQGAAFSYLYPFSTVFYRKFGYEIGCERMRYTLKLSQLPPFEVAGSFHLLEPDVDLKQEIRSVYDAFSKRYNMMTIDGDIEYQWVDKADPFRDQVFTFLYRSADGMPKGVVTYKIVKENADSILDCGNQFWFVDREGLETLLHLVRRLMANHSHVRIYLPSDVELSAMLPELKFGALQCERATFGMVRVVDAQQVLRLARMRGDGELIIKLSDEQIQQNNGTFHVRFADGTVTSVERTETEADVTMTIQAFSRLICGCYDVQDWGWLSDVTLHCEPQKAAQVFYRKPMYITRYF